MDEVDNREDALLASLSSAERERLELNHWVRSGDDVAWIEPDGTIRRERISNLYYIHTRKGVFRVSRISGEVVPV